MNVLSVSSANLNHFMDQGIPKDSWHSTSVIPKHGLAYSQLNNLVKHIFPNGKIWNKSPGSSIFNK